MKYDPHKHHRRSIRLPEYDYSQPGLYFLTLCTYQRGCLFGAINNRQMQISPLGEIVREEMNRSSQIRREIELRPDEFIIMPNHIHAIVRIIDPPAAVGADGIVGPAVGADGIVGPAVGADGIVGPAVGEDGIRPAVGEDGIRPEEEEGARRAPQPANQPAPRPLRREGKTLGSFVAGFKSSVTARARRELGIQAVWQRNYYEHIIRTEAAYTRILAYIQTNPLRWTDDQLHPAAPPNPYNQDKA